MLTEAPTSKGFGPKPALPMHLRFASTQLLACLFCALALGQSALADDAQSNRRTPLVSAVEHCREAVVNLRGRKIVAGSAESTSVATEEERQVNGMGTGVIIDSRGYILTNYHVVQDVRQIQVTTADRQTVTATLLAHDPETDLALLKINSRQPLTAIRIGSSSDLLLAETVAAVGNAYGYEHTVTVGIISHLNRTVQVNEKQIYRNLIQTDASINPGNSGGPLLNLDGEVIGINVAVRVGAQGIAFAIPINDAIEVAARLIAQSTGAQITHGLSLETSYSGDKPRIIVQSCERDSTAATNGLKTGDQIVSVDGVTVVRAIDFQKAMIDRRAGDTVQLTISNETYPAGKTIPLALTQAPDTMAYVAWKPLGLQMEPASEAEMAGRHANYQRGQKVVQVRAGSPAEKEGIQPGDILVAMHGYKTESIENLAYILKQPEVQDKKNFLFYILRNRDPFFGQLRIADTR